jgi:ribosomal protein L37AE/L43A
MWLELCIIVFIIGIPIGYFLFNINKIGNFRFIFLTGIIFGFIAFFMEGPILNFGPIGSVFLWFAFYLLICVGGWAIGMELIVRSNIKKKWEKYKKMGSLICPYCGHPGVDSFPISPNVSSYKCRGCGYSWQDGRYKIIEQIRAG